MHKWKGDYIKSILITENLALIMDGRIKKLWVKQFL
jgi:hypothetical protein